MNSKDRILQFIEYKDISKREFYLKTTLSNGLLDKVKTLGADNLEKIYSAYPELNLIWVVTGKGDMLVEPTGKSDFTPIVLPRLQAQNTPETAKSVSPTKRKTVTATVSATQNLGVPKVVLVNEREEELISVVPQKAAAGYLNGYADPEFIENLPRIRIPGHQQGSFRAFEVKGHSMNPTVHNSAISVGKWVESFDEIKDRRIYIVVTRSEGIVIKRVLNRIHETGKLVLISDNHNKREYPNILLDPEDVLELWYQRAAFIYEFPEPGDIYSRFNDLEAKVTMLEHKMLSH